MIPVWHEYTKADSHKQASIIATWQKVAEQGRNNVVKVCDANLACNLLERAGQKVSFRTEIDAGMRARADWLRSLPIIETCDQQDNHRSDIQYDYDQANAEGWGNQTITQQSGV